MATFYKYKERDDISKSMIDWSGLTKDISDNLMAEKNKRDQIKQELEEDQLNKIKAVEEFTQGLDPSMNQAMIKVSQQYKDYLLTRHRLMKQGLVSVNDTKLKKQGAIDTFDSINNAAKDYNVKMAKYIETGGNLNDFAVQDTAEILNIADSQLVIDDMGRGTFIKVDENGNEIAMPANSFATIMDDVFDRFNDDLEFTKATEDLAKIQIARSGYFNVTDFRQEKELYNEWLTNKTKEILNTDKRVAEVAADLLGIEATRDKEEAKEKGLVLFEYKNGKRSVNVDYVRDKVKKAVENGLNSRLDRIEERTPYRPTADERNRSARALDEKQTFSLITRSLQGDKSALQSIISKPEYGIANIVDKGDGKFSIVKDNGDVVPMDINSGISSAGGNFANAIGLSGEKYINFNTSSSPVNTKFSTNLTDVEYIEKYVEPTKINTSDNISKLNKATVYDIRGNQIEKENMSEKVSSYRRALQEIAGPLGIETSVDEKGNVTINGEVVTDGILDPAKVLSIIEGAGSKGKKKLPGQ